MQGLSSGAFWYLKFSKRKQSSQPGQWEETREQREETVGGGSRSWARSAGGRVSRGESGSDALTGQDLCFQATLPGGTGQDRLLAPNPFLTFHSIHGHWRCLFLV